MEIDLKGFSIRSVMKRAGLDESTYYRLKKDERAPRQSTIDKIEKAVQEMVEEREKYQINADTLRKMKVEIVLYRAEKNISQKEFFELCGVSTTTWHRFQENGYISTNTFKKIVDFLEKEKNGN